jgi:hypothetical protein
VYQDLSEKVLSVNNAVFWDVTEQEPHGVTSQKTAFVIAATEKTSNL